MAGEASDDAALVDAASWAAAGAYRDAPHTAVEETDRLRWLITGTPYEGLNGVFWARGDDPRLISAGLRPFREAEVPMLWHVGATSLDTLRHWLPDAGLATYSEDSGMVLSLNAASAAPEAPVVAAAPEGLEIRQVGTMSELRAWIKVWTRLAPPLLTQRLAALRSPVAFGFRPRTVHLLGVLDGAPVACAAVWVGQVRPVGGNQAGRRRDDPEAPVSQASANGRERPPGQQRGPVAWLEHVTTAPQVRRCGIGGAMTLACLQVARRRGARRAVLTASPAAVSLYRRLGFQQVSTVHRFFWTPR